jgi:hypothetical protein
MGFLYQRFFVGGFCTSLAIARLTLSAAFRRGLWPRGDYLPTSIIAETKYKRFYPKEATDHSRRRSSRQRLIVQRPVLRSMMSDQPEQIVVLRVMRLNAIVHGMSRAFVGLGILRPRIAGYQGRPSVLISRCSVSSLSVISDICRKSHRLRIWLRLRLSYRFLYSGHIQPVGGLPEKSAAPHRKRARILV